MLKLIKSGLFLKSDTKFHHYPMNWSNSNKRLLPYVNWNELHSSVALYTQCILSAQVMACFTHCIPKDYPFPCTLGSFQLAREVLQHVDEPYVWHAVWPTLPFTSKMDWFAYRNRMHLTIIDYHDVQVKYSLNKQAKTVNKHCHLFHDLDYINLFYFSSWNPHSLNMKSTDLWD